MSLYSPVPICFRKLLSKGKFRFACDFTLTHRKSNLIVDGVKGHASEAKQATCVEGHETATKGSFILFTILLSSLREA